MFNIGPQELLVILLVALVIVGPQRLPELARTIGRALNELRRAQDEVTRTIRLGLDEAEPVRPGRPKAPAGRAVEADGPRDAPEEAPQPAEEGSAAEVARTLGRGLAEIRRARREVQRTFRLDLAEEPVPPRPPAPGGSPRGTSAPVPPAEGQEPPPGETRAARSEAPEGG